MTRKEGKEQRYIRLCNKYIRLLNKLTDSEFYLAEKNKGLEDMSILNGHSQVKGKSFLDRKLDYMNDVIKIK